MTQLASYLNSRRHHSDGSAIDHREEEMKTLHESIDRQLDESSEDNKFLIGDLNAKK
jgi:hypothetical protein